MQYDSVFWPCHGPSSVLLESITSRHRSSCIYGKEEGRVSDESLDYGVATHCLREHRCLAGPRLQEVTETFV
jgi:hypothetical protein